LKKKIRFILRQKWFWFYVAWQVLIIVVPYIIFATVLDLKGPGAIEVRRSSWGAKDSKEDLVILQSPISKILVTHTNDANESCSTFVRPPTK